jgi:hypothetical protein
MGHDPQPRVGQASDQAITVNDRVNVAGHAPRTDPGEGTLTVPSDSRVTHHAADDADPAVTSPRPAATTLTGGSVVVAHLADGRDRSGRPTGCG